MTVKVTQDMLNKAATAVAKDNKVLARVLVVLHSMKCEPALNSETAWVHKTSGTIKEGDDLAVTVKGKLVEMGFQADLSSVLDSLSEGKKCWDDFLDAITRSQRESVDKYTEWLERFYEFGLSHWSEVDDLCWGDTMHSWDDEGRKIIVMPSERRNGGKEYRIVALDPEDIISNSYGRTESLQSTVTEYFTKPMIKATKTHIFDEKTYDIDRISSSELSAAAVDSGLITYTVVHNLDGKAVGIQLCTGGDGLDNKMLTPTSYLRRTYVNLLANKDRQIEHITAISNDPDEPTLCYIRNDYTKGDCPTWVSWIADTFANPAQDGPYFMAWIGSILDAQNRGKQTLYLHGYGSQGMTKVVEGISSVLGPACTALSGSKSMTNQFGLAKLEGKRLVVISDNKNPKILMTEWVHNLTGGDIVDIERKGKDSHTARLMGKLWICSNVAPEINFDEQNQKNRILYIPLKRMTDKDKEKSPHWMKREDGTFVMVGNSEFPKKLIAEAEAFLCLCYKYYEKLAPTRSDIVISSEKEYEMEAALTDTDTMCLKHVLDKILEFGDDFECDPNELYEEFRIAAKDSGVPDSNQYFGSRVKSYLHNLGVDFVRPKVKVDGVWKCGKSVVKGVKLKETK